MANQLARGLLADLPDDTELGLSGHSVASLKSELESHRASGFRAYLRSLSPGGALERLRTASDDNLTASADSLLAHGEPYAISTLVAEPPP